MFNFYQCLSTSIFIFVLSVFATENEDPRIQLPDGKLRGLWMFSISGRPIEAFLSIPYAAPPVGILRFKSPIGPQPWSEERNATSDPPSCVLFDTDPVSGKPKLTGQEDCLYLNVFRPNVPESSYSKSLPVLFYIHGGGLVLGSSSIQDYGPQLLLDKDIILVTINYRLEILGFLTTGDEDAPGNYALKDQVFALKWVRKNIHYFGGDPEQITIYGHSSGGYSVQYLMLSPASKGLFHRAISASGTMYTLHPYDKDLVVEQTKMLAKYVDCPTHDSELLIKCLQSVHVEELFKHLHQFKRWNGNPFLVFGPVVESDCLETDSIGPVITLESLTYSNITVPWMTGLTSEDGLTGTAGLAYDPDLMNELNKKFDKLAPSLLRYDNHKDKETITRAIKLFYLKGKEISRQNIPQFTNLVTDASLLFGILKSLSLHKGPIYLYYFSHRGKYSWTDFVLDNPRLAHIKDEIQSYIKQGVAHSDELQYIFPMMKSLKRKKEIVFSNADEYISRQMIQRITDFISLPDLSQFDWKNTSLEKLEYLSMGSNGFIMKEDLLPGRVHFWYNWIDMPEKVETSQKDEL